MPITTRTVRKLRDAAIINLWEIHQHLLAGHDGRAGVPAYICRKHDALWPLPKLVRLLEFSPSVKIQNEAYEALRELDIYTARERNPCNDRQTIVRVFSRLAQNT